MILRRLAQHLREQNWTAIAIEFVLLVAGVFLGIQVANWNDDRQQAARQVNYLERLRVDFVGIRSRIEQHFVIYEEAMEGGDLILSLLDDDGAMPHAGDIDAAQIERAFNALVSNRIPPPLPATYVEMRSEGQLSHIRSSELRDRLADYDRLLGVVQEVARMAGDTWVQQVPVMQRHFISRTIDDGSALSGIRNEVLAFDLDGMRDDRDFAVAVRVLQRNAHNSREQRRTQLQLIDQILALIDEGKAP